MAKLYNFILFFILTQISFSFVPIWDFKSSTIDLFQNNNEYSYNVVDRDFYGFTYNLTRKFYFEGENIRQINTLFLNGFQYNGKINYDDIDSAYSQGDYYYVCPKGKFTPFRHNKYNINEQPYEFTDGAINTTFDWDLNCFHQHGQGEESTYLFVFFLCSKNELYEYSYSGNGFRNHKKVSDGIYAYKWRISKLSESDPRIQMFAIVKDNDKIYLKDLRFILGKNSDFDYNKEDEKELGIIKTNFTAFFNSSGQLYDFTWINYNTNNIEDYECGFHKTRQKYIYTNITQFQIQYNYTSPFKFSDNVKIIKIKLISDEIAYYILNNIDKKRYYYGLINVVLNKVIFNTDEEIVEYKPYKGIEMLAITKKKIYKICIFGSDGCPNNCYSNLYLKPNDICIKDCDENYFFKNENECWLCKDYNNGEKKYKLINSTGCLENIIDNAHIEDSNLNLIACNKGYQVINNSCIRTDCYENCKFCTEKTDNKTDQKCIECKNDSFLFEDGNCVENCKIHNFISGNECKECSNICKTCNLTSDNCLSCEEGLFLEKTTEEKNTCQNCSSKCKTCQNDKDFCLECNIGSNYSYFLNNTCLQKCPNDMKEKDFKCVYKEKSDKNNSQKDKMMLWVYAIICSLFLIIILLCFYKRFCRKNNSNDKIIEDINTELIENNNIIN